MTESKDPEGGSAPSESTGTDGTTSEAVPKTERVASDPPMEPAPSPVTAKRDGDDDEGRESIEVEALEPAKPPAEKLATHRPPPPPSIRAHGAGSRAHFELTATPKVAQDLMSRKIMTIGPDDKLLHLEEHMEKFRFGHLPVVQNDKLVGLITHGDLMHASASFLTQKAKELDEIIHSFPASRIMRRDPVTVPPSEPLAEVAKLMWERKVGCVLVTEGDKLLGIITEGDFLRLAHHFLSRTQS